MNGNTHTHAELADRFYWHDALIPSAACLHEAVARRGPIAAEGTIAGARGQQLYRTVRQYGMRLCDFVWTRGEQGTLSCEMDLVDVRFLQKAPSHRDADTFFYAE